MTPNFAIVHVSNPGWCGFRFWIPLFLLWIPLVLLSPLLLLILLVLRLALGVPLWRSIGVYWKILCGLPGTEVQVRAQENRILIRVL
jgi:hypothetical protein